MITCRDCGHKNVGAIYCIRCGSELFRKNRRHESDPVGLNLGAVIGQIFRGK